MPSFDVVSRINYQFISESKQWNDATAMGKPLAISRNQVV